MTQMLTETTSALTSESDEEIRKGKEFGNRVKKCREDMGMNQQTLATKIGVSLTTIQNYEGGQLPKGSHAIRLAQALSISLDFLFLGKSSSTLPNQPSEFQLLFDEEIVMIPMVEAVLSAGGGSFETNGNYEKGYAFRRDFIRRKGNPNSMVLMRVSGDSMEPEIRDGDVVLLDQSKTRIVPGKMFAVGFEESIYIKRIDNLPGKVILKSENPAYPPVELDVRGDLAEQFRVIGRVLWCGREYK